MIEPQQPADGAPDLQDGLAYLLLFSEALLGLVPDGVAVLDERLRIRSANPALLRLVGLPTVEEARQRETRDLAFFAAPLSGKPGGTLAQRLEGIFDGGTGRVGPLEVVHEARAWVVHADVWDTEDPQFRRILITVQERGATRVREAILEEKDDRIFSMAARSEALLGHLPLGVIVLDPALRVVDANGWVQTTFGHSFRPQDPGDRHLFAVFPVLRDDDFRHLLEDCRDKRRPSRGTLTVQPPTGNALSMEVEVQTIAGSDRNVSELLLLIHEVQGMTPAEPTSEVFTPIPCDPDEILAPANLARWPAPNQPKILVVESDPWMRMIVADSLREAGHDDITLVESGREASSRFRLGEFGMFVVGLEGNREDALRLAETIAKDFPASPILGITDRDPAHAREAVGEIRLMGMLTGPFRGDRLRRVVDGILAVRARTEAAPSEADSETAPTSSIRVVLLGAQESDVSVLRLLYRVQQIDIRLVYDPEPDAFGLSLAQNLGIATMSGELALDTAPDAIILARSELEARVDGLDLPGVVRVTRDELELFLVDPASFLDTESDADTAAAEIEDAADESNAELLDRLDPTPSPTVPERRPSQPSQAAEEFAWPEHETAESIAPPESVGPIDGSEIGEASEPPFQRRSEAAPPFEAQTSIRDLPQEVVSLWESGRPEHDQLDDDDTAVTGEVGQLLRALDLLLDFERLSNHVLGLALELSGGASGSLMLLQENKRELRIVASTGLSDLVVQKTRQRVGEGIAGRVADDGEPLLLLGTIGDERFKRARERQDIRSSLCVPVISEGRIVGVINVNSDPRGHPLGREALREVARLGRQIGSAIDRSLQLRRIRGRSFELSVRAEIEAIAAAGEDMVSRLRRITGRVVQMLNVDVCGLYLLDAKRNELVLRAVSGVTMTSMDAIAIPVGSGTVGWVAKNLSPLVLRGTEEDKSPEGYQQVCVAVPIRYHTDLIGVFAVESTRNTPVDDERLDLIGTIASVIGQQIGESRAHEDSERRVTMLSALSELGVAFTAARERMSLAKLVTFSASTVLESDVSTIRLLREGVQTGVREPEFFELMASHGASISGPGDPLTDLEERVAREVLATSAPCRDLEFELSEVAPLMQRSNVSAVLGVPMLLGDELIGVITVYRVNDAKGKHFPFREEEIEIATRLGDYAAGAANRFVTPSAEEDEDGDEH